MPMESNYFSRRRVRHGIAHEAIESKATLLHGAVENPNSSPISIKSERKVWPQSIAENSREQLAAPKDRLWDNVPFQGQYFDFGTLPKAVFSGIDFTAIIIYLCFLSYILPCKARIQKKTRIYLIGLTKWKRCAQPAFLRNVWDIFSSWTHRTKVLYTYWRSWA